MASTPSKIYGENVDPQWITLDEARELEAKGWTFAIRLVGPEWAAPGLQAVPAREFITCRECMAADSALWDGCGLVVLDPGVRIQ